MFEHYIKEQQELLPYLDKYYQELKSVDFPEIGIRGINWDEFRIKSNVNKWLREIRICADEIRYAYCFSKAYNSLSEQYLEDTASGTFPRGYEIRTFELHFWIACLLNRLHSYREKIAHLLFDLYDQAFFYSDCGKRKPLTHDEVTFFRVLDALKKFKGSVQWIPEKDHNKIMSATKSLCDNTIDNLFKIRHAFTHRARPAIDTTGTGPIMVDREWTGENEVEIFIIKDVFYSYPHIESQFLRAWDLIRESTLSIAKLDCFK